MAPIVEALVIVLSFTGSLDNDASAVTPPNEGGEDELAPAEEHPDADPFSFSGGSSRSESLK